MVDPLLSLTPDKWGTIEKLSEQGVVDLDGAKTVLKEIALKRLEVAESHLEVAKILLEKDLHYRSIISRAYYCMYHAARAAVYIQLRLDVQKHQQLVTKFKEVLKKVYNNETLGESRDDWRMTRDYYLYFEPNVALCNQAILQKSCKEYINKWNQKKSNL
ncbi:MAG: HEPN domain-containing protein [Methanosarcinales archaeon]